jgi:hypothetical protein
MATPDNLVADSYLFINYSIRFNKIRNIPRGMRITTLIKGRQNLHS